MENQINVSDIDPAELLAALYNRSFVNLSGLGFLREIPGEMTIHQAREFLDGKVENDYVGKPLTGATGARYFDYLQGRVMKVEINGETLNPDLYDRDLGKGAAKRIVNSIRARMKKSL